MQCPRCSTALVERAIGHATVQMCPECWGALVQQRDLVHVLETVAPTVSGSIGPDEPVTPIPDAGQRVACPVCRKPMTAFGYMGMPTVTVDRCSDDWVIWADTDELGTMSLMYARTNRKAVDQLKRDQQRRLELDQRLLTQYRVRAAKRRGHRRGRVNADDIGALAASVFKMFED